MAQVPLILGAPWTCEWFPMWVGNPHYPYDLTGKTLISVWRDHNTDTELLSTGTADGTIELGGEDAPGTNYLRFVMSAADTDELRPATSNDAFRGEVRLFDVRIWETAVGDGGTFLVDLSVKGRT